MQRRGQNSRVDTGGQNQRQKTNAGSPSFSFVSSAPGYSPAVVPKKLDYDDYPSFPSSSSSSVSTSEDSDNPEDLTMDAQASNDAVIPVAMNPVELASDIIGRLIPNVPSEFDQLRVHFSNQKIKVDDNDPQTILMVSTLTEEQKEFLNSGKTQFKEALQQHNQKVSGKIQVLDQFTDTLKAAKKAKEDFLKNYKAHWKQNEENRVKLIKIKKALARAYYQAACDYLNENIAPINQNEDATSVSSPPTKSISTIMSPTKSGVTSPESSPKKTSTIARSLISAVQKGLRNQSALVESYDEKFNPGDNHDKENSFSDFMALGFCGNKPDMLLNVFEDRVANCSLDQIAARFNYLLTHFNQFHNVSSVHRFLKTQLELQTELKDFIPVTYDDDKKIGSFILDENLLRQDRQLISEDQNIGTINPKQAHLKEINQQFSKEQPERAKCLALIEQAGLVLKQEKESGKSLEEGDKEVEKNSVLSEILQTRREIQAISVEKKKHLDDLDKKTILYRRYLNIPNLIAELKKQEILCAELIQENLNKQTAHDQLMLQYLADLESLNAMILEEDARNAIVKGSTGEQPAAQKKKKKKTGAEVSQAPIVATSSQQSGAALGVVSALPSSLQMSAVSSQALSSSSSVAVQIGDGVSAQVDSQVADVSAVPVLTPKSDELEKDYKKIEKNVLDKGNCGFDDQKAQIKLWFDDYDVKNRRIMLDIDDANKVKSSLGETDEKTRSELIQKKSDLRAKLQARLTKLQLSAPCTQNESDGSVISDEDQLSKEVAQYNIKDSSVADLKLAQKEIDHFEKRKQKIDARERNSRTTTASTPTLTTLSTSTTAFSAQVNSADSQIRLSTAPSLPNKKQKPSSAELKREESQLKYKIYRTPSHQPSNLILFSFWIILVTLRSAFEYLLGRKLESAEPASGRSDSTPVAVMATNADKSGSSPRKKRKSGGQNLENSDNKRVSDSSSRVAQSLQVSSNGNSAAVVSLPSSITSSLPLSGESKQVSSTQPAVEQSVLDKLESDDLKPESAKPTYKDIKNAAFKSPDLKLDVKFYMLLFNFAPVPNRSANECVQGKHTTRVSNISVK